MNNQNNTANNAVNVYNPLIEAAKPVFILANSMQQTTSQLSTDSLINKFSLLINNFEENAEKNGAKYDAIQAAKYCLCTFVDELAVRAGWADETWSKNSLLVSFYDETWGGERFFEIIQNLKQDSDKNINLLEFMYLCLQFGYKGKYQVLNNGELEIDKIKRDLLALIHSKRPDQTVNLFKHNPIITNNIQRKRRLAIPLWVVVGIELEHFSYYFYVGIVSWLLLILLNHFHMLLTLFIAKGGNLLIAVVESLFILFATNKVFLNIFWIPVILPVNIILENNSRSTTNLLALTFYVVLLFVANLVIVSRKGV